MRGGRDAADLDGDGGAANVAPEREGLREGDGREMGNTLWWWRRTSR